MIEEEIKIPQFNPTKDYSGWPRGAPVVDDGQVYKLVQPYHAAQYKKRPAELAALWSICHTRNPMQAKPWMAPRGTSGLYMEGKCYLAADGEVYRCRKDGTAYHAAEMPELWEKVQ